MQGGDGFLLVLAWLGTYLIHSTLFLSIAWLCLRGRSIQRPRFAERGWRFAVLAGILTASIQVLLGARPLLGRLALESESAASAPSGASTGSPPESALESEPGLAVPAVGRAEPSAVEDRIVESARRRQNLAIPSPTIVPARAGSSSQITRDETRDETGANERQAASSRTLNPRFSLSSLSLETLLLAWVLLGGVGIALFAAAWSRLIRILARRRPIDSGPLVERLRELERKAQVSRPVRLSLSARLDSPITVGWVRKEIVLPDRALRELSANQIESMLAHELAHAVRQDPAWFSIYALIERALFFQPLNRLARVELNGLAELLCDDWAVALTGRRLALASCLTEVAQWIVGARRNVVPAMADGRSRLSIRVERLLEEQRSPQSEPKLRGFSLSTSLSVALFVIAVPGVSSPPSAAKPVSAPILPIPSSASGTRGTSGTLPEPAAKPAAPAETDRTEFAPATSAAESDLTLDHEWLETELESLAQELTELACELEELGLSDRFAGLLQELEGKLAALRARRDRLHELLPRALSARTPHRSSDSTE